jgi:hypothetical protein
MRHRMLTVRVAQKAKMTHRTKPPYLGAVFKWVSVPMGIINVNPTIAR